MSQQIYVRAQPDHIISLTHGAPLPAVEELIWNALDADAREVKVDVILGEMPGSIKSIRVTDNGLGIDASQADEIFGNLGGSWKRESKGTPQLGRSLHGCHGCGRFKAFSLGVYVDWRTTVRTENGLKSYKLSGTADNPEVFELEDLPAGVATGTEVLISTPRETATSLLQVEETLQHLASRFALYLKNYPDVRIYFNGLPVTPIIVQKQVTDYKLTLENGTEAKLEIIEWKNKFHGTRKLVLSGPDGFALHDLLAGVRTAPGVSYTAYLVAARFPTLAAENALIMEELHPEVRQYLDAARKILRAHFLTQYTVSSAFLSEWQPKIAALSVDDRRQLLQLLKRSLRVAKSKS